MVTPDDFRRIALNMPESLEGSHMVSADFRVQGKVFAAMHQRENEEWGMVKLTPDQQARFMKADPAAFVPAAGAWGVRGATLVLLRCVGDAALRSAISSAWRNTAPKRLIREFDGAEPG